jgi:hypothetical protein
LESSDYKAGKQSAHIHFAEESGEIMSDTDSSTIALIVIGCLLALAVYLLPTIIAFCREHH